MVESAVDFISIDYVDPTGTRRDRCYLPRVDDFIVKQITDTKTFYEIDLLEHMFRTLPHTGIYIDVGANIGNHTVFFSKFLASNVLAVEAHPRNYELLGLTMRRNNLDNVTCTCVAAGESMCEATLSLRQGREENPGEYSVVDSIDSSHSIAVRMQTLDAILANQNSLRGEPVTAIKLDVEGYEAKVLAGASQILKTHRPHIFAECQSPHDLAAVSAILFPLGYRVIGPWCATPVYHFACWGIFPCLWWNSVYRTRRIANRVRSAGRKVMRIAGKVRSRDHSV